MPTTADNPSSTATPTPELQSTPKRDYLKGPPQGARCRRWDRLSIRAVRPLGYPRRSLRWVALGGRYHT